MHDPLLSPVKHKVTAAAARKLAELGVETVGDALAFAPRRYYHWGKLTSLSGLVEGQDVTVLATVASANVVRNRSGKGVRLVVVITDGAARLSCTFFAKNEYALSRHRRLLQPGEVFLFAGRVSEYRGAMQLVQPQFEEIESDSPQAIKRQSGQPIPIYPAKSGIPSWKIRALIESILVDLDWAAVPEIVPPDVLRQETLLPIDKAYQLLHNPDDDADWQAARRSLAFREALVLQLALLHPRVTGQTAAAGLKARSGLVEQLIDGLPFELTEGQRQAWDEIQLDLGKDLPMQRLLQADVGAGKTVIALLAMTRTVENGRQAALLAPTEVLARQHFASLTKQSAGANLEIPIHLLTASTPAAVKNEVLARLAAGEPSIVVGTHALIQDGVELPNLGLLVVDEQHRFGVAQREKLRENRDVVPHLLVMTATPIPRTIAMTVFGDLDVTTMTDMPSGRTPIKTHVVQAENKTWMSRLWQRAREEIEAGGRVYVVCPRIAIDEESGLPSIEGMAAELERQPALAGVGIAIAHGEQRPEEQAASLESFAKGETPLLLATTVVEVGVDVPEATMMVIMGAGQFGLSQLHQLRGRVGRSNKPSVAMLVHSVDNGTGAAPRLRAMEEFSDGFALAEVDLQLRKEGDVLGRQQSGNSTSLRFISVRRDAALIAAARDVAKQILAEDPTLAGHPHLLAAVNDRAGQELVWLERA